MGQAPSSTSRHDNASTRTLHSTSVHSSRPTSFFRRISHKLHKPRRFRRHRPRTTSNMVNTTTTTNTTSAVTAPLTNSSVAYETQEAARAAAAVATGPNILYHLQSQSPPSDSDNGGTVLSPDNHHLVPELTENNTTIVSIEEEEEEDEEDEHDLQQQPQFDEQLQLSNANTNDNNSNNNNNISIISLFQLPGFLNSQENGGSDTESLESGSGGSSLPALLSLILLSYFGGLTNDMPGTSFITIQRPQSEHSSSSTDTITSIPFSLTSHINQSGEGSSSGGGNGSDSMSHSSSSSNSSRSSNSDNHDGSINHDINGNDGSINSNSPGNHHRQNRRNNERSIILILHGPGSGTLSDNPTYEELLMLGSILGQARPDTTTQAAIDEAIPATFWSETTKKNELIGTDKCLVCLDEFIATQAVRILKCRHVFHKECVDRWLCESHNSCPVCRRVPVESNNEEL